MTATNASYPLPDQQDRPTIPVPAAPAWPAIDHAAFHGLPGDIARIVGPHTEGDPTALLVLTLLFFGNAINRGPHTRAEADRHAGNENVAFVGETSRSRKGSVQGQARRLYESADPDWTAHRMVSGLSSGEGLIWAVRDPIAKYETKRTKQGTPQPNPLWSSSTPAKPTSDSWSWRRSTRRSSR